jgi:hypothetical protein
MRSVLLWMMRRLAAWNKNCPLGWFGLCDSDSIEYIMIIQKHWRLSVDRYLSLGGKGHYPFESLRVFCCCVRVSQTWLSPHDPLSRNACWRVDQCWRMNHDLLSARARVRVIPDSRWLSFKCRGSSTGKPFSVCSCGVVDLMPNMWVFCLFLVCFFCLF